ncbi:hypothetical protein [Novosphingobium sp.]|uniref:spike base protein, RCAP_Rcc01079 family n=1 Tax=Novosphingobium sp. TaxID=1874826 RepID=UPI00286E245D|nr:hypothetical protein [Novosphingobium sp.]
MPDINPDLNVDTSPLEDYIPITPGSSALANGPCRAVLVTAAGTINLTTYNGTDRDGIHLAAGIWHPIVASKIRTGGTATGIFAGY